MKTIQVNYSRSAESIQKKEKNIDFFLLQFLIPLLDFRQPRPKKHKINDFIFPRFRYQQTTLDFRRTQSSLNASTIWER